jgi:tetratricopeptide (TPR) repeat protein
MVVAGLSVVILLATIIYLNWQPGQVGSATQSAQATTASPAGPSMTDLAAREQAVLANPNDPTALLALANGLHDSRDWRRAISTYEKYLEKVPGNPDAQVDMGICYFELAQQEPAKAGEYYGKAVAFMRNALEGHPDHQPAAFNLGVVNLQMGNIQESNKWLKRAVELGKSTALGQRAQHILEEHTLSK